MVVRTTATDPQRASTLSAQAVPYYVPMIRRICLPPEIDEVDVVADVDVVPGVAFASEMAPGNSNRSRTVVALLIVTLEERKNRMNRGVVDIMLLGRTTASVLYTIVMLRTSAVWLLSMALPITPTLPVTKATVITVNMLPTMGAGSEATTVTSPG